MTTVNGTYGAQEDPELLEQQCRADWNRDPALRAEFGEFDRYLAFEKNKPNIRILGGRTIGA